MNVSSAPFILFHTSLFCFGLNIHVRHGSFMISGSRYRNLIDNGSNGFIFCVANDDIL